MYHSGCILSKKLIIVIAPITKPSRPDFAKKIFLSISTHLPISVFHSSLHFYPALSLTQLPEDYPSKRLMKSKCTGANGTGSPATDEQRTVKIAPKFPDKRNCIAYKIAYTVSSLRVLVFWIIYRATDMAIIIAHKPINRSDTIGVMWNHIICTAAVPYNKKVTIFPCQSAPCTFPVFLYHKTSTDYHIQLLTCHYYD